MLLTKNLFLQPLSQSEVNAEGFYYMITYQRRDTLTPSVELKTVVKDWQASEIALDMFDLVFKQFLVYVEAVNSEGFAQYSKLDMKIGYSGEGSKYFSQCWSMGTGTIFEDGGHEMIRRSSSIFFTLAPLLSNLPTLDIVFWPNFWVGKSASLPTQITKRKTRIICVS